MSSTPDRSRSHYERVKEKAEDYTTTVHCLLGFVACVIHDGPQRVGLSQFGLGRRMETSTSNVVQPSHEVTPDLVVQRGMHYGMAVEAKKSLPTDQQRWRRVAEQLRKYDDDLSGWWTQSGRIDSDAVLLIDQARSRAFKVFLDEQGRSDPTLVGPHSALVEFSRSDYANPFLFFRLEWGTIREATVAGKLENGVNVPVDAIKRSLPAVKFCDARPPVELLLQILWTDVFLNRSISLERDERLRAKVIDVEVGELAETLQQAFGSGALFQDDRSVEFPRKGWLIEAMDLLVRSDLAHVVEPSVRYRVLFRDFKTDVLEKFASLTDTSSGDSATSEENASEPQLPLEFLPPEDSDE